MSRLYICAITLKICNGSLVYASHRPDVTARIVYSDSLKVSAMKNMVEGKRSTSTGFRY